MSIPDDDSEIPRIDLVEEFGPDNPNVQVNPMFAALSIGMQQMPGSIQGMKVSMEHFMNATDSRYRNRPIDTRAIERMMFDPDERTIERIIGLMETRYDEIEELEQRLLKKHLEELKRRASEAKAKANAKEEDNSSDSSDTSSAESDKNPQPEKNRTSTPDPEPIIEEVVENE